MSKAIAITSMPGIDYNQNPFLVAFKSAENSLKLALDFMYGTPERTTFTYIFALGLLALGYTLGHHDLSILQNCPV